MLVPAIVQLFGECAWWLPSWLDNILPRISVEPHETPAHPHGELHPRPEALPEVD